MVITGGHSMDSAIWIFAVWCTASLVAAPMIGLLGRMNDAPTHMDRK